MSDELLRQILNELVEMRKLIAGVQAEKHLLLDTAEHQAEMEMVDRLGLDPVEYLRERARRTHRDKRKPEKKTRKKAPAHPIVG